MDSSFLRLEGIQKKFGIHEYPILVNITISFQSGYTYAIEGVSGTGKSTLMHIIATLDIPSQGTVFFNTQNCATMSLHEKDYFLQHSIGFLFQQPYLIKELTVLENVMLPGLIAGKQQHQCKRDAQELIDAVSLSHTFQVKPGTLSGGQQQRIALARALINKPAFLLADEPTGNLDEQTRKHIIHLICTLQQSWHMGVIVTTHDKYVANTMQHRYILVNGFLEHRR
jgi:ABC-type lipoprotein export system ATPase subunit